jgi:hypothetical protein
MLLLWRVCGDPQPFSVEIGPAKTVDELKKAIVAKNPGKPSLKAQK